MPDFKPPLHNKIVVSALRQMLKPVLLWNRYNGIEIDAESVEQLRDLEGQRTIICSNHSHRHDSIMLFALARILDENFHYIAARELFDWWHGFMGWGMQRVGCYSVTRGIVDRASISMTKRLIIAGRRKLAVFPECEISGRNDQILPVEPGLCSLFLSANAQVQELFPGEPVNVLPVALRYNYVEDISAAIGRSLSRVEGALGVPLSEAPFGVRLRNAACILLQNIAQEYGYIAPTGEGTTLDFGAIIRHLIDYASDVVGCRIAENCPPIESVRLLRNELNYHLSDDEPASEYIEKLRHERRPQLLQVNTIMQRVLRLYALQDFASTLQMSQENLANGIDLLEREIFGRVTQKGRRSVRILVGDPINLADRYQHYLLNKRGEIQTLTNEIELQLMSLLAIPALEEVRRDEAA